MPIAEATLTSRPADGLDSSTAKLSSASTTESPITSIVRTLLLSPAANVTVPPGRTPPAKSEDSARSIPEPTTEYETERPTERSPFKVRVKVNAVVPPLPSAFTAEAMPTDTAASSLAMVAPDEAVPIASPPDGFDSVTTIVSSGSTWESPTTVSVIVRLVSPAAKVTVPVGNVPPEKSDALAGLAPDPDAW